MRSFLKLVHEKYGARGFDVLAINLEPAQHDAVLPLLTSMGVAFVPLQADWAWAEKIYGVDGTPATPLIDAEGRIMFKPVVHDDATRLVLEREVEALLGRYRTADQRQ